MRAELEKKRIEAQLSQLLAKRPALERLQELHVLPAAHVHPRLQARLAKVEKAHLEDQLNHKLAHRPSIEELKERHVLLGATPCFGFISLYCTHTLTPARLSFSTAGRRPGADDSVAPRLQAKQRAINKAILEQRLERKLANRPSISDLVEHNYLQSTIYSAVAEGALCGR